MISICMIVKDEEDNLKLSLKAAQQLGYEIIVVDTGSIDGSMDIALEYTDKVFQFKWNDDFSAARNFAVSKASNDFILVIDADEIITYADINEIEKVIMNNSIKIGRVCIKNQCTRDNEDYIYEEYVNRIFDRKIYQYNGKIHEQITSKNGEEYSSYIVPIELYHNGYTLEEVKRKDKVKRNIKMLKNSIREDQDDPYLYYQLGKTYYMNGDYGKACDSFEKSLDCNVDTKYEYVEDLIETYGYSLINIKEYSKAMIILNLYDEYKFSADYLFLCGIIYMNNGEFENAISNFLKASKIESCKMQGINDYLSFYNIGIIYECLGKNSYALKYYSLCGEYDRAKNRIKVLSQNGKM